MDISRCSLKKQCELLGLPYSVWRFPKTKRPELAVMDAVATDQRKVAFCEGGSIQLLLYCLSFDCLCGFYKSWAASQGHSDPDEAAANCMYVIRFGRESGLLKRYPQLHSEMVATIANARESNLLRAFDILQNWQRQPSGYSHPIPSGCWRFKKWVGVDREFILALFQAFGAARCALIAKGLLADAIGEQSGWPDLVWVEGRNVGLIEVKTTDKLHASQIMTFPKLQRVLQVSPQVARVQWK